MRGVGDRAVIGILFVFSGCTAGIDVDASEGDDKSQASTGQEAPADATDTRPVAEIIAEQCACAGPWSNHGDYVSCVAHATNQMKAEGRISGKEKGELQSAAAKSECGRASVEKGCPGEMLPSQCGTWEGVELLASRAYATNANQCGKKKGSPKEHFTSVDGERCLCAAISFEIPATIAVRAGDAGSATAKLTFTDAAGGGFTTCFFRGEGTSRGICDEPSTPNELGQRFIFESCSDGAVAGDVRLSQYFLFSVDGSPLAGVTTADLRLGEPDVVGGVVQLEEFVTTDANIIGEALIIPRGVVPPFQDFTLVSNAEIAETSIIGDQEMFIVLGPSSNVNAVGINGAYLFNPSDPCVRLRKTYEPSWLVPFGLTPSDLRLYKIANPIEVLAGEAPTVIEATDIPIVDETNHTISACVSSLSWFFAGARLSRTTNLAPIAIDSRPFVPYGGTQVLSPFDNATYVNGVLKPCGDEDQFFPFEDIATTRVFVPEAGIDVRTGIVVSDSPSLRYVITASGTVVPFPGSFVLGPWGLDSLAIRDIGPSGAHPERAPAGFPVPGAPVYALVARIGAITNKYFQTGGSHDVIPRRGEQGHLILRVNDDTPGDGTGGFDVTITTQIRRARCSEHVDRNLMIAVWSSTGAFERSGTPNIILGPWREKVDRYAAFLSDKKPDVIILNEVSMEGGGASWGDLKPGEWLDYFVGAMERVTGDDFAAANSSAGFHCKLGNLDVGTGGDAIVYRKSRLDLLNTDERYGTTINSPDSFNETMGLLRSEHARVPPAFVIRPDKPSTTCNDIVGGYSQPTLVAASFEFPRGSGRFISVGAAHLDGNPDYELLHPFFARIHQELPGPAYPPFFGGDLNYNWGDWFTYTKWLQGSEVVSHDNQLRNWAFDLDDPRAERRAPVQCLLRNFKPAMSEDDFARGLLHIYSGKDVWGSALPASLVTNGDSLYDERAAFCGGYRFSADPAIYHYPCALGDHGAPWRRFHLASRMDGSAPRHVAAEDFIPSEMPNAADECQRWAFNDIARTCNYEEQTLAWCPSEPPFSRSGYPAVDICDPIHVGHLCSVDVNPSQELPATQIYKPLECTCAESLGTPSIFRARLESITIDGAAAGVCSLVASNSYRAHVRWKNTGTMTWTRAAGIFMTPPGPFFTPLWGKSRIDIPDSAVVRPGDTFSFDFDIVAPTTLSAGFEWQLRSTVIGRISDPATFPTIFMCNRCGSKFGNPDACSCSDGRTNASFCPFSAECNAYCSPPDPCAGSGRCACDQAICANDVRCHPDRNSTCCDAAMGLYCTCIQPQPSRCLIVPIHQRFGCEEMCPLEWPIP